MKTVYILVLIMSLGTNFIFAQFDRAFGFGKRLSGTEAGEEEIAFWERHKEQVKTFDASKVQGIVEFPVKVHIVRSNSGESNIAVKDVQTALNHLNDLFLQGNIRFVALQDYSYLNNDELYKMKKESEESLCKKLDVDNVINLYIVNKIKTDRNTFDGYTYYPREEPIDRIFITEKALLDKVTFARQMGHYFFLYPTHGYISGMRTEELVDGSNCTTSGDEICDTPADPNLGNTGSIDSRCDYVGTLQDGRSRFYRPATNNIMSDNPQKSCQTLFTPDQYHKILYTAFNIRRYLEFPKEEFPKRYITRLAEQYGVEGGMTVKMNGRPISVELDHNLYIHKGAKPEKNAKYRLSITNYRKGYVYALEGDSIRGINLIYPVKEENHQVFFKDFKKQFDLPSENDFFLVDEHPGANYICIFFSRKPLPIDEWIEKMNELEGKMNLMQRLYIVCDKYLGLQGNISLSKNSLKLEGIASDRYVIPLILKFEHE